MITLLVILISYLYSIKLIDHGFPSMLVNVLLDWCGKTFSVVKWASCYSHCYLPPITEVTFVQGDPGGMRG